MLPRSFGNETMGARVSWERPMAVGRLLLIGLLAIAVSSVISPVQAAPEGSAGACIRDLGARAVSILQSSGISLEAREAQFRDILISDFDIPLISKIVLGRNWKTASPEQRGEYQRVFGEYVLRTYSSRLGGYTGETLQVVSERPAGNRHVVVSTLIERPAGPPIKAEWRVRTSGERFRIVDVVVEGISMVITQRSEFAAVIQRNGLDGLIQVLRVRLDKAPAVASVS